MPKGVSKTIALILYNFSRYDLTSFAFSTNSEQCRLFQLLFQTVL